MFIAAAVLIAIGSLLLKLPDAPVMIGAGALLVVTDLIVRSIYKKGAGWLWRQTSGGYLVFMPVWIFGLAVIALNVINKLLK